MGLLDEFSTSQARPLPVLLLLDVSGSMRADDKIEALNAGVQELLEELRNEDDGMGAIHVGIITFGGDEARLALPFQPVGVAELGRLDAGGRTPLGGAFDLARQLLEDRDVIPSRAYRPTIALMSDGIPTDEWEDALAKLLASERASKATRMAVGVGADADRNVLVRFAEDVRRIEHASQIRDYLQFVTMTVAQQAASSDPEARGTVDAPHLPRWEDERY